MIFFWLFVLIFFPENFYTFTAPADVIPSRVVFETKNLPKFRGKSDIKKFTKCSLERFSGVDSILGITFQHYNIKIFDKNGKKCKSEHESNFQKTPAHKLLLLSHLNSTLPHLSPPHHFFNTTTVLACESLGGVTGPELLVEYYEGGEKCQRNIEYQIRPNIAQTKINTFSRVKSNEKLKLEVMNSEMKSKIVEFKLSLNFDHLFDTQLLTLVMYSCFDVVRETAWFREPQKQCWSISYQQINISKEKRDFEFVFFTPFISFANKVNPQLRFEVKSSTTFEFGLRASKAVHKCSYWREDARKWSGRGCWTIAVERGMVRCGCSHMSVFNAITQFTPKFINFTESLDQLLNRNTKKYAISGMASFWLFFLCIAVVARYYDHLDEWKANPIDLADNDPDDLFMYLLVVNTGKYFSAGTTSKVYVQLFGERAVSSPHKLDCRRYKVLKRGQRNLFVLRTQRLLGPLEYLIVWIEGYKDSWYCKSLEVIDLEMKKIFYFILERWMSPRNLNFLKLYPSSKDYLYKFEPLMVNNICRSFEECNTWFSILYRPIGSNFSRLQRLSRAVTLLLGNLSITLMFFDKEMVDDIVRVGKIKLTYVALATSLYNLILVVPFTSTTSNLFKFCKHVKPQTLVLSDWRTVPTIREETFLNRFHPRATQLKNDILHFKKSFLHPAHLKKSIMNTTLHNSESTRQKKIAFESSDSTIADSNVLQNSDFFPKFPPRPVSLDAITQNEKKQKQQQSASLDKRQSLSRLSQLMPSSFRRLSKIVITKSTSLMSTSKPKKDMSYSGMEYRDEYLHSYYPHWTYTVAWVITITMIIFHTILTMLYVVNYTYEVFEKWVITSCISFMFLIFMTNPVTTLITAFFYSALQCERFEIPVIHLEDIKEEILKNLSNVTPEEEEAIQTRRASRHREPRNNGSDYQHKKYKELMWQRGLSIFTNEAFFCIFLLLTLSYNASLLHDGYQVHLEHFDRVFQSLGSVRNFKITTEEDYWEWLIEIFESTYDSFPPRSQLSSNMVLRRPCFRVYHKKEPGNVNFEKIGTIFSSSICVTNKYSEVKRALTTLKELNLLHENIQGITCNFFLYNVVIDKMVSVDLAIRKNVGGGVTFYSNHAAVNLFYTRSNTFHYLSFMFLATGSFCILGVIHRMYKFGFGLFFCSLWNVLMLGMVSFFTGMSFLWKIWLSEWNKNRSLILSFKEFSFQDFDTMQNLAIIPFAILLFVYIWRNLYFFCPNGKLYANLNLISRIVKRAVVWFLVPMIIAAVAFIKSIDALTYTNEEVYSRIVKALIATSNNKLLKSPKYTYDSWLITFFVFKLAIFVSILIGKLMCFAVTRKKYMHMKKVKRRERPPNLKYMSYYFSIIFRTNLKKIYFQEHVNYSHRKGKILKKSKHTKNKIRDEGLKQLHLVN